MIRRRAALAAPLALPLLAPAPGRAQARFNRPIRLIAPFAPGATVDLMARAIAGPLGEGLGQPVLVENRAGAGGNVGIDAVAKAPKDGHVLGLCTPGPLSINPHLMPAMPFDPATEIAPVSLVALGPNVLAVAKDLPVRDVPGLVALARSRPGQLSFGSSGVGSTNHLAGAAFAAAAGVELVHVPYRGNAEMANDLLAGRLDMVFSGLPPLVPLLSVGTLRALAVTGPARLPSLPGVPTIAEAGQPEAAATIYYGLVAPGGTPAPVLAALAEAARRALERPEIRAVFEGFGTPAQPSTPEEFAALIEADSVRWRGVIRRFDIRAG
ncbi:tripartite tricarboxylate transporter substrate binding protein [Siccirubricoccus sp. KC 17139]|uniref:Tripartite tricarboxylate transporter substrate binding protein n=1 Tax=Siccirubricoccus soli TaxID=2899147 RepID=A0ABT1D480_9PROT|nr:tripartite tricarboxylate transporter substrate-binding protein [Siccirubricoccus soli]MCO6416737.1 tripartite tricarboxylate transporter substrate binding protein [Siccirubricoccus soli]MCP2682872.1 tripartite tricarboxylate transporter substrate-binding protein [Siccirubricoccus soli]